MFCAVKTKSPFTRQGKREQQIETQRHFIDLTNAPIIPKRNAITQAIIQTAPNHKSQKKGDRKPFHLLMKKDKNPSDCTMKA
jgi:hypothetical protein